MEQLKSLYTRYRQLCNYVFWGVLATVVSWGTYSIFTVIFKNAADEFVMFGFSMPGVVWMSNMLSWLCAMLFAFVTNKLWVFESKSWERHVWLPEFCKFATARFITGVLEIIGVPLLVGLGLSQTILGIEGMVSKITVSVLLVIMNYIFSKVLVFRDVTKEKSVS